MKTITIDMSKAKGENVFANVAWKEISKQEIEETMNKIKKYKR